MIELHVSEHAPARATVEGVKRVAGEHPGDHELRLLVQKREPQESSWREAGRRVATLTLGPEWRYSGTPECLAALSEFGAAAVVDG